MTNIDNRKFEELDALNVRNGFTFSVWRARCARLLGWLLQPGDEILYLNTHLRRDAGIDATDVEREKIRRAPLIR